MAENQPIIKHRMNQQLVSFAARLREWMGHAGAGPDGIRQFPELALELFALQFASNPAYRRICEARQSTPQTVEHWTQIPAVPAGAFKELELSSIPSPERTAVFHSSGTTDQKPSRHFHCAESLALYETSLWEWFQRHFEPGRQFLFLTPDPKAAPHSSLAHMMATVQRKAGGKFLGTLGADGGWTMDFEAVVEELKCVCRQGRPATVLGTAFSYVHLVDWLAQKELQCELPRGSQIMETGGYKSRSRVLPKSELHALITRYLGPVGDDIICEYGMSELSSQAYDNGSQPPPSAPPPRIFRFPPWARAQIISPETGREVSDGGTGLIRIFDLANTFSVAAIQTDDLGIRRGDGFEWLGRAQLAETRGCSLTSV